MVDVDPWNMDQLLGRYSQRKVANDNLGVVNNLAVHEIHELGHFQLRYLCNGKQIEIWAINQTIQVRVTYLS